MTILSVRLLKNKKKFYFSFTPEYLLAKNWLVSSSWQNTTKNAINKLSTKTPFVLLPSIETCSVVSTRQADLLDTKCISNQL